MKEKIRKFIILDRDGVINKEITGDYVRNWAQFRFLPGVKRALVKLAKSNYKIIVVSNQAGIGKGLVKLKDYYEITRNMLKELKKSGVTILKVYFCPHTDEDNCDCRKPKIGMLTRAKKKYGIDFEKTFYIGNSWRDVVAGKAVGCKTIFVGDKLEKFEVQPDYTAKDLASAVEIVLREEIKILKQRI